MATRHRGSAPPVPGDYIPLPNGVRPALAIPHRKVGAHRTILMTDIMAYKRADDEKRNAALDELAAEAQRHRLEY